MIKTHSLLKFCAFHGWVAALLFSGGCATTVVPTQRPVSPVAVYVADYGIHSSLLLPTGDREYVEYCFGDWGYAAENHNGPHDALGALLVSQQSALGRRYIDLELGQSLPHPDPAPLSMSRFNAEKADVDSLVTKLNARYQSSIDTEMENPETHITFVRVREHYSVANNCNNMTAWGLRELHCELHGLVGTSKFNIVQQPKSVAQAKPIQAPPKSPPSARLD